MATYLDFAKFRALTTMPAEFVDDVEKEAPGWVENQLEHWARWIDARLRNNYATPFNAHDAVPDPTPPTVQMWLARIVTLWVWNRRGVDGNDLQIAVSEKDHDEAKAEVLEAANSDVGWFDIPLRVGEDGSALRTSSPMSYSEQSPYVNTDEQRRIGRSEDGSGRGTSG